MRRRKTEEIERRGRQRILICLGLGYILGWVTGYDTARQKIRRG